MKGEWRLNLEHLGIEIAFPGTPPAEIRTAMVAQGFRWSGRSRVWYTKDAPDRREWVAAQDWATQGEAVGTRLTFEERMVIKAERAAARGERLVGYIESAETRAARQLHNCREIGDIRPIKQPAMVDTADMNRRAAPNTEAVKQGPKVQDKTTGGAQSERYGDPAFLARRIKECKTQLRRLNDHAREWENERPLRQAFLAFKASDGKRFGPGWDDRFAALEFACFTQEPESPPFQKLIVDVQSKLAFCQRKLEELGGATSDPGGVGATAGSEPQQGPIKTPGEVA